MVRLTKKYGLTAQQRSVMLRSGNLLLNACPGSGKTTSISGRVAKLLESGSSVALLSHTKVGAKELSESVFRNHKIALTSDSYAGTIHSFVGRYLLRPFGHLVTGSDCPVLMEPDEAANYYPPNLKMKFFQFTNDGAIKYTNPKGSATSAEITAARQGRLASAKAGVVSYDDGLYWSLKLLREYPKIAAALALRFDEIIVDEAQDSNESQIQILETLHSAKLKSLVMVGDFDQSIYGFGGANPDRCRDAANRMGLRSRRLSENHRASQRLCNVSAKFRTLPVPDAAVGAHAALQVPPVLVQYRPGSESNLTTRFTSLIADYSLQVSTSAVLVRQVNAMSLFTGDNGPKLPKDLANLLSCARGESPYDSIRDLERLLISRAFNGAPSPAGLDRLAVRTVSHQAVRGLPPLNGDAFAWAQQAVRVFDEAVRSLSPATAVATGARIPTRLKGLDIGSIGGLYAQQHRVATVHGTKGESIDAIMIVAAEPNPEHPWMKAQADVWAAPLGRLGTPSISEELRIFYVALTRARQLAVLAVPNSTSAASISAYQRAGFVLS